MKIYINQEPYYEDFGSFNNEDYKLSAELESTEESNALDVLKMVYKAMIIEGYNEKSIIQSMHDLSEYEAWTIKYEFKEEE